MDGRAGATGSFGSVSDFGVDAGIAEASMPERAAMASIWRRVASETASLPAESFVALLFWALPFVASAVPGSVLRVSAVRVSRASRLTTPASRSSGAGMTVVSDASAPTAGSDAVVAASSSMVSWRVRASSPASSPRRS